MKKTFSRLLFFISTVMNLTATVVFIVAYRKYFVWEFLCAAGLCGLISIWSFWETVRD